jgi:hypothetical protein
MERDQYSDLRTILIGEPIFERGDQNSTSSIDSHLIALMELMPSVYGSNEACMQAVLEIGNVAKMPDTRECMACKRAMFLYALATETEVSGYWDSNKFAADLARDLSCRVLPFLVPRFMKHSCQTPESFVLLSLVLADMWHGEDLGNFSATHHDGSAW